MYNGLQNDMTSFAKFAFIFEKEIKANVKNEEFKSRFKTAFELYEHKVKCHVRYVKQKDIATITDYAKLNIVFYQETFTGFRLLSPFTKLIRTWYSY